MPLKSDPFLRQKLRLMHEKRVYLKLLLFLENSPFPYLFEVFFFRQLTLIPSELLRVGVLSRWFLLCVVQHVVRRFEDEAESFVFAVLLVVPFIASFCDLELLEEAFLFTLTRVGLHLLVHHEQPFFRMGIFCQFVDPGLDRRHKSTFEFLLQGTAQFEGSAALGSRLLFHEMRSEGEITAVIARKEDPDMLRLPFFIVNIFLFFGISEQIQIENVFWVHNHLQTPTPLPLITPLPNPFIRPHICLHINVHSNFNLKPQRQRPIMTTCLQRHQNFPHNRHVHFTRFVRNYSQFLGFFVVYLLQSSF